MKTFGDLQVGDRIYYFQRMKIGFYTITSVENFTETSIDYTWNHEEVKRDKNYTIIKYINSQNKEFDIEFNQYQLEGFKSRTRYGSTPIFSDRNAAIKHVTDLFDYRKGVLADLQARYDKERTLIEKYKDCLSNLPD